GLPDLRRGHHGHGLLRVRQPPAPTRAVHHVAGGAGQAGPTADRTGLLRRRGLPGVRLEPPRQVVPPGWGSAGRQGLTQGRTLLHVETVRAFAARNAPIVRDAVLVAVGAAAVLSRG